jgi:hypothetical protein
VPICNELPSSWWSPEIGLHLLLHAHINVTTVRQPLGIKSICVELKIPKNAESIEISYLFHFYSEKCK